MSTIRPDWGTADAAGHGTGIAGLSLYGDLTELLASAEPVLLEHRLESSKLLVEDGGNTGDEHLHADLTRQAVYNPQIAYPDRKRVFELAVSASDYRDEGRPAATTRWIRDCSSSPQATLPTTMCGSGTRRASMVKAYTIRGSHGTR
jgi:hypothetical protein